MLSATGYKVGALSDLISGGKKADLADLFTSAKKQKDYPVVAVAEVAAASPAPAAAKNVPGEKKKKKKKKGAAKGEEGAAIAAAEEEGEEDAPAFTKPSLKSLVRQEEVKPRLYNEEEESRTVFVGNLPASAKKKKLKLFFSKIGAVESVRFRGAARPDLKTTKKVAVITGKFHESRHNINAYVRFVEKASAVKSCKKLNGKSFEGFVIRVDSAGVPKKMEQRKAVFLGNLDFAIEEDAVRGHFQRCGDIADVRLVRDAASGIGKGFGYVNFKAEDGVELAVELNGSQLNGRAVRVERCVKKSKIRVPSGAASGGKTKKVTRKKARDLKEKEQKQFQGTTSDKGATGKKSFPRTTKDERRKKMLSKKLLRT